MPDSDIAFHVSAFGAIARFGIPSQRHAVVAEAARDQAGGWAPARAWAARNWNPRQPLTGGAVVEITGSDGDGRSWSWV